MVEKNFNLGDRVIVWNTNKLFEYFVGFVAENRLEDHDYADYIIVDTRHNISDLRTPISLYDTLDDRNLKIVKKENSLLFSKRAFRYIKKLKLIYNGYIKRQSAEELLHDVREDIFHFTKIKIYCLETRVYKFFTSMKNFILALKDLIFSDIISFYKTRREISSIQQQLKRLSVLESFDNAIGYSTNQKMEKEKNDLKTRKDELQKTKNESSREFVAFIISVLSVLLVFFQYKLTRNQLVLMQKQTEIQENQLRIERENTMPHFTVSQNYIRNKRNEVIGDGLYIVKDKNYAQNVEYNVKSLVFSKQLIPDSEPCVYFGLSNYFTYSEENDDVASFSSYDNLEIMEAASNIIGGKVYKNERLEALSVSNYIEIKFNDMYGVSNSYYFKSDAVSTIRISEESYIRACNIYSENDIGGIDNLEKNVEYWVKRNCTHK